MWDEVAKGAVEGLIHGILSRKPGSTPGELEATCFVLRDAGGKGRAVLTMLDGGPALTLLTEEEKAAVIVALDSDGPFVQLSGVGGTTITARIDGHEPDVSLYDSASVQRASLNLDADGSRLQMWDAGGRIRAQLLLDQDEGASLTTYDENGKVQSRVGDPE